MDVISFTQDGMTLTLNWGVLTLCALLAAALIGHVRSTRAESGLTRLAKSASNRLEKDGFGRWPPGLLLAVGLIWLVLFMALIGGMVWIPLRLSFQDLNQQAVIDLRWFLITLTALVAALGALVALPFTFLRTAYNARQTRTAEQGQITDRINKAVEALGAEKTVSRIGRSVTVKKAEGEDTRIEWRSETMELAEGETVVKRDAWQAFSETIPNTEVRIGAIYALERIAQDSIERDHIPIMEILTAYIRENAPATTAEIYPDPFLTRSFDHVTSPQLANRMKELMERSSKSFGEQASWARDLKADTIIQAAMQVISRRNGAQKAQERSDAQYGNDGYRLDLRATNLQAIHISGGDLARARLDGARLAGAQLEGAYLEGAHLEGAHLEGAQLKGAHLEGAHLDGSHLEQARLDGAHLEGARLLKAHLERAHLEGAHLDGAWLTEAHMENAWLVGAQLDGAVLSGAYLEGVNLHGAHLDGAKLSETHLGEFLSFSPFTLRGAGLKNVHFRFVTLTQSECNAFSELLAEAFADGPDSVRLPDGVARPEHWANEDLSYREFEVQWRAFQRKTGYTPPPSPPE